MGADSYNEKEKFGSILIEDFSYFKNIFDKYTDNSKKISSISESTSISESKNSLYKSQKSPIIKDLEILLVQFFDNDSNNDYILSCIKCNKTPKLYIINNKKILLVCDKCRISKYENIENMTNKSSKWISVLSNKNFGMKDETFLKNQYIMKNNQIAYNNLINLEKYNIVKRYEIVYNALISLERMEKKVENSMKFFEKTQNIILETFLKKLNEEVNLFFVYKIILNSLHNEKELTIDQEFFQIEDYLKQLLNEEEIKKFKLLIKNIKKEYIIYSSHKYAKEVKSNSILSNFMFALIPNIQNILYLNSLFGFEKKRNLISEAINFSSLLKRESIVEKVDNPEKFVDINKELNNINNIAKKIQSIDNKNFILSLLSKSFENNGTIIHIEENKEIKKIILYTSLLLFLFAGIKKYEIHFEFGTKKNNQILNDEDKKINFIDDTQILIAKKLNISKENIFISNIQRGCVSANVYIRNSNQENERDMNILAQENNDIEEIIERPIFEEIILNQSILENNIANINHWEKYDKIGGEDYFPPFKWTGFNLNINELYNDGNHNWLNHQNTSGEYAVAYLGINNHLNDRDDIIHDLNNYPNDINNIITSKLYQYDTDLRNRNSYCGEGVVLFQDPNIAENYSGIVDTYGIRYKIIIMCRVNPKKIRQPISFPFCWILNPSPDEIRPVKILIKRIIISPLLDNEMKVSSNPIDYIINDIRDKNLSIYRTKNEIRIKRLLRKCNKSNLKNELYTIFLYSSYYYVFLNKYLINNIILERDGHKNGFPENQIKSWVYCLQKALSKTKNTNIGDNQIVYRGLRETKFPSNIGIGSTFYNREFMSTSLNLKFARDWIKGDYGSLLKIEIKNNGTNGHPIYSYLL